MVALVALIELAAFQLTVACLAAFGANKAVRPAQEKQCLTTLLLGAVLVHKFMQSEAFLELHRILAHGKTLFISNSSIIPALAWE